MVDTKQILTEIAEMDFICRVLVVGKDGRLLEETPHSEDGYASNLGDSMLFASGALGRLGEAAETADLRHTLIEFKNGVVFLADLGEKALLGIIAKPEINRGYLLSHLPSWSEQLRDALG